MAVIQPEAASLGACLAGPRNLSALKLGRKAPACLVRTTPMSLIASRESLLTPVLAEIFGSGDSSDSVARDWLEKYRGDNAVALTDLINCILQCIGCEHEVTEDDIRDEENIPNRLHDLQNVYQEVR